MRCRAIVDVAYNLNAEVVDYRSVVDDVSERDLSDPGDSAIIHDILEHSLPPHAVLAVSRAAAQAITDNNAAVRRASDSQVTDGLPVHTLYDPEDAAFLHDILANAICVPSYAILAASRAAIHAIADRGIAVRRVDCDHDTKCRSCDNRYSPSGPTCGAWTCTTLGCPRSTPCHCGEPASDLAGQLSTAPAGVPVASAADVVVGTGVAASDFADRPSSAAEVVSDVSDADIVDVADVFAAARAASAVVLSSPPPPLPKPPPRLPRS